MKIIAADDERPALNSLISAIKEALPDGEYFSFMKTGDLLEFAKSNTCDIAFLDIQMRGMNGIELAKRLKDLMPNINIIFATGFTDYALEAFELHVSGYLMKPITAEAVKAEISNLRKPILVAKNRLYVQTFGNFEVFFNQVPVKFARSKSKEVFAYLIDKQGTAATTAEIASAVWEDGVFDRSRQKQLQSIISSLVKTLAEVKCEDAVIKNRQGIMVDKTKLDCDLYSFMAGDVAAINSYKGQYMYSYSWAEFTVGYLDNRLFK